MENNRGQSIFLSVVGIATLLVAIVGATFAYFSITVRGNEEASSIVVTTAQLSDVFFEDGDNISVTDVYPGWTETKTFTIRVASGTTLTQDIPYRVDLVVVPNSVNNLATAAATNHDFVYTLALDGGSASSANDMPASSTTNGTAIATGTLTSTNSSDTYVMTISIPERGVPQDELQGKAYSAVLQVTVTSDTKRTWNNTNHEWSEWTSGS